MFTVKENRVGTLSLVDKLTDAEVQRECSSCRELKLASDFQRYTEGCLRSQCRECFKKTTREYNRKSQLNRNIKNLNDRALRVGLEGDFTIENYKRLVRWADGRCMLSDLPLEGDAQIDHLVPLNSLMVGSTASNLWLLHKRVNEKKWIHSIFEYLDTEEGKQIVDRKRLRESMSFLAELAGLSLEDYIQLVYDSEEISRKTSDFFNN
ncbi:hypothetical protein NKR74_06250 [Bacillus sp. 3103sda1]|uniref:hypothetical protein n=1 Tax=Bacillus sp. 3103sda1 TaxID=2953808 RepID=UPI00209F3BEA|nr:hypothetical protein [Bacillus sp. 3103sda1]MCP1122938.1 hypothetical protein [Bacillus sp. 3103sda1]